MAAIGVNSFNFTENLQGIVVGVELLFYGLSGTIFSQIFYFEFAERAASGDGYGQFLLTLAVCTLGINLLGLAFMHKEPTPQQITPNDDENGLKIKDKSISKIKLSEADLKLKKYNESITELDEEIRPSMTDDRSLQSARSSLINASLHRRSIFGSTINAPLATTLTANSLTVKQILKSPEFWMYLITLVFAQGITYMSNISTIVISLNPTASASSIAQAGALHITIISISQSIGRFGFGLMSDLIVNLKQERSILLVIAHVFNIIPIIILAMAQSFEMNNSVLYTCSVFVGLGFGGVGALFPILTREFFGMDNYGTACSLLMTPVPIGIIVSNLIFATSYDSVLKTQGGSDCYGSVCFYRAFEMLLGVQLLPLVLAVALLISKLRSKRGKIVPV